MAFQQPQPRPQAPRQQHTPPTPEAAVQAPPPRQTPLDKEWILFSPVQNADQLSVSYTSQTPRTATHLSDFGSLETHVRSQPNGDSRGASDILGYPSTDIDEDGTELDSLDDGLHAFHHPGSDPSNPRLDQSGGTVLPTHDGLGTFPSATGLQEHLWQFERYNPHRRARGHHRRRSSLQQRLDAMEEEPEVEVEDERTARVEKWRLEQSRAVLEEIERETRRRRRRMNRMGSGYSDVRSSVYEGYASSSMRRHDSSIPDRRDGAESNERPQNESFWRRITRRVIQDLIGLDENTLSIIFGEELAESSPTPTQPSPIAAAAARESHVKFSDASHSWETKLLERISQELGVLVHQLAEHDGAAFSTYRRMLDDTPEYAGFPRNYARPPSLRQRMRAEKQAAAAAAAATSDKSFSPTVPQTPLTPGTEHTDTSLWGIEEEPEPTADETAEAAQLRQEREYWERDVDVNVIFSYLKNRFSNAAAASTPVGTDTSGPLLPASWATSQFSNATSTLPERGLRRAEVIRRQHPLVSRAAERAAAAAAQRGRRESLLRRQLMLKRPGSSSCASQSTRRSRHSRSGGSSRHYWDLGGSVGSVGSGPALGSAIGTWGEV